MAKVSSDWDVLSTSVFAISYSVHFHSVFILDTTVAILSGPSIIANSRWQPTYPDWRCPPTKHLLSLRRHFHLSFSMREVGYPLTYVKKYLYPSHRAKKGVWDKLGSNGGVHNVAFMKSDLFHHNRHGRQTIMEEGTLSLLFDIQRTNWIATAGITVRPQACQLDAPHR